MGLSTISILCFYYFPQTYPSSTMRPITILKRLLAGDTPSILLPPGIDDDATSNPSTGSSLLVSQNGTQANHVKNTKEVECQTSGGGSLVHVKFSRLSTSKVLACTLGRFWLMPTCDKQSKCWVLLEQPELTSHNCACWFRGSSQAVSKSCSNDMITTSFRELVT